MVNIAPNPFILADCTLKVGADNYEASVSAVEFKPTPVKAVFKGLTPTARFPVAAGADWTCDIAYAQDWATANALARYFHEHEGETIAVEFEPVAGGPGIAASITIVPGSIGGAGGSVAAGTVSLDSTKPVLDPAV